MIDVTFITDDGVATTVKGNVGDSIMMTALAGKIAGIVAECGGAMMCATCHVYVDESFMDKVGEPDDMEKQMLQFAADVHPNSRLSCQINVTEDLDGLTVSLPEFQM